MIGFDDLDMAEHLSRSTVRQPLYESFARGARMLLDIMEGGTPSPHVELPPELVARGSMAPPRPSG